MKDWQAFEALVANIHRFVNASDYTVETDVLLEEPSGATHQVDILLRPRTSFAGPVLVSCKAWAGPVGVDHVREWSDIVQHTGSASGVIVAKVGFTADALKAARNVERRVSLWRPRELTDADFAPDEGSPNGYIAAVQAEGTVVEPHLVEGSFRLDVVRADGRLEGREVSYTFSAARRTQWYLRDEQDTIVENLWDLFVERATSMREGGEVEIVPPAPRFLVFDGVRMSFVGATFEVELREHTFTVEVNLRQHAVAYENVLTGQIRIVPDPPREHQFTTSS